MYNVLKVNVPRKIKDNINKSLINLPKKSLIHFTGISEYAIITRILL